MRWIIPVLLITLVGCVNYTPSVDDLARANRGRSDISEFRGMSMFPALRDGDRLVCKWEWDNIETGAIICGYNDGTVVAHRAVYPVIKDGIVIAWRTRGDANDSNDYFLIWPTTYMGTVVKVL